MTSSRPPRELRQQLGKPIKRCMWSTCTRARSGKAEPCARARWYCRRCWLRIAMAEGLPLPGQLRLQLEPAAPAASSSPMQPLDLAVR